MNDVNNAKSNIADKIHAAVSSLIETELRLNSELSTARSTIDELEQKIVRLQDRIAAEQEVRERLEQIVGKVSELVR